MTKLSRCIDTRSKRGCCPDRMDFFGSIGRQGCGNWKGEVKEYLPTTPTCVMPCRNFRVEEEAFEGDMKKSMRGCGCTPKFKGNTEIPKEIDGFPVCQMGKYEQNEDSDLCDCVTEVSFCDKKDTCKSKGSNGGYYYQPVDYENIELQHGQSENYPTYQNCQSSPMSAHDFSYKENYTQSCSQSNNRLDYENKFTAQSFDPNSYHLSFPQTNQSSHPSPQAYNMPPTQSYKSPVQQCCQSSTPKSCKQLHQPCIQSTPTCAKTPQSGRSAASPRTGTGQPPINRGAKHGISKTMCPTHKHGCQSSTSRSCQPGAPSHKSIGSSYSQSFGSPCPKGCGSPWSQSSGQGCQLNSQASFQTSGHPCSQLHGKSCPQTFGSPCSRSTGPSYGPSSSPSYGPTSGSPYSPPCGPSCYSSSPPQSYGQSYPQSNVQQTQCVIPVCATLFIPVEQCCCSCPMVVVCPST